MDKSEHEKPIETGKLTASTESCTEAVSEIIVQATDDITVKENLNAILRPLIIKIRRVDMEATQVSSTKDVEKMDETEILEAIPETKVDRMSEMMDFETTPKADEESISEIINPEIKANNMMKKLEEPNTDEFNEIMTMGRSTESISMTENSKSVLGSCTGVSEITEITSRSSKEKNDKGMEAVVSVEENLMRSIASSAQKVDEMMNQYGKSRASIMETKKLKNASGSCTEKVTELFEATPLSSNEDFSKVTGESNVTVSGMENLVPNEASSTEEANEMMDQDEVSKTVITETKKLKNAPGSCTEKVTEPFEATPLSSNEDFSKVTGEPNATVSGMKNLVPNDASSTEEANEMMDQDEVSKNVIMETKKLKNASGSCTENVTGIIKTNPVSSNEKTSKVIEESNVIGSVVGNLVTSNVSNTEEVNEMMDKDGVFKASITETRNLKIASGRKRKRKIPIVSKMVLHCVKSLKKNNGASFEDIKQFMEENYPFAVKAIIKNNVCNFLQKCVDDGTFEEIDGADVKRFKFKEDVKKPIAKKQFKTSFQLLNFIFENMKNNN